MIIMPRVPEPIVMLLSAWDDIAVQDWLDLDELSETRAKAKRDDDYN